KRAPARTSVAFLRRMARIDGGEVNDVVALAGERDDLGAALTPDLVDADDGVDRHVGHLHAVELRAQAFLGRTDHERGPFAELQPLDSNEAVEGSLPDLAGAHLVDLPLVYEDDLVKALFGMGLAHGA